MIEHNNYWHEKRYRQQQAEKKKRYATAYGQPPPKTNGCWVRWEDVQEEIGALHEHIGKQKEAIARGVNRIKYLVGKITRLLTSLKKIRTLASVALLLQEEKQ